MHEYKALLALPGFRGYWLAVLANSLGSWGIMATLPLLVAQRYGAGMVLVFSMGLKILPKLVLAPVAGRLLRRFGAARVAGTAMLAMAVLVGVLPRAGNLVLLQGIIAATGTLDLFILPGLLSLRASVTPPGLAMAGNTMFSVADRSAKVIGPALGGLLVLAGFGAAFAVFALLVAAAAVWVRRLKIPGEATPVRSGTIRGFIALIRGDAQVAALLIVTLTYLVMLGGMRPFLFWANREWFGASDAAWTALLAAQGGGALIGAVVAALFGSRLRRAMTAYTLSMLAGMLEGLGYLALLLAGSSTQAIVTLTAAGIPEIVSTAAWFTAFQERLSPAEQALFYTFTAPLWDACFALGIASAGLHAEGALSLSAYWALVTLTATLPLAPLLLVRQAPPRLAERAG